MIHQVTHAAITQEVLRKMRDKQPDTIHADLYEHLKLFMPRFRDSMEIAIKDPALPEHLRKEFKSKLAWERNELIAAIGSNTERKGEPLPLAGQLQMFQEGEL